MAREYEPNPAAPCPEDPTLLQRRESIQDADSSRNMGAPKYDTRELRALAENLTHRYQGRDQKEQEMTAQKENAELMKHGDAMQERLRYKTKIGEAMRKIYPPSKKQTKQEEPACVTRLGELGTEPYINQLDQAYKKSTTPQQDIDRRQRKFRCQTRKLRLQKILAWRQSARYTKNNARKIRYAGRPIIDLGGFLNKKIQEQRPKYASRELHPWNTSTAQTEGPSTKNQ